MYKQTTRQREFYILDVATYPLDVKRAPTHWVLVLISNKRCAVIYKRRTFHTYANYALNVLFRRRARCFETENSALSNNAYLELRWYIHELYITVSVCASICIHMCVDAGTVIIIIVWFSNSVYNIGAIQLGIDHLSKRARNYLLIINVYVFSSLKPVVLIPVVLCVMGYTIIVATTIYIIQRQY